MSKLAITGYILLLVFTTLLSYFFIDPNLPYLSWFYSNFQLPRELKTLLLVVDFAAFFSYYLFFINAVTLNKISKKELIILVLATVVCLLPSYPAVLSYDIFNYIATAKVSYFYQENPYILMPIDFTGDPILQFMHAPNKTALYGPFWIFLTLIPHFFGFGNFLITMFLMKLLPATCYLLLLFCLYRYSKRFAVIVFFGLNPLVIIETLLSSHNDIVMMVPLFISLFCLFKKDAAKGWFLFLFSFLVKYATLILLPIFLSMRRFKFLNGHAFEKRILRLSMYAMFVVFLLSFLREEIYPWYAIWFLPFVALVGNKKEKLLSVVFSASLLGRYFPYLITLTHFGSTPLLKSTITFVPIGIILMYLCLRSLWSKK